MDYTRTLRLPATESLISSRYRGIGKDTIRVFTTHLQSVLFSPKEFHDLEIIKNVDDSILDASRSIAKKLRLRLPPPGDQAPGGRAVG
jgi:hypothetical protein